MTNNLNSENSSHSLKYIPEFDGLRAIAVLIVMIFHLGTPFFIGGYIGIDIFFVLSGFLITTILLEEYKKNNKINLKKFYMRRILRLLPAFIFLLLVYCAFSIAFLSEEDAKNNLTSALFSFFYLSNWVRAFELFDLNTLIHTWSLSTEEQFYILWPIILIFLLNKIRSKKTIFYTILFFSVSIWFYRVLLAVNGASIARLYNGLDTRGDTLMIGCALAFAISYKIIPLNIQGKILSLIKITSALAIAMLIFIVNYIPNEYPIVYYLLFFLSAISIALLLFNILAVKQTLLKTILSNRVLIFIGKISYGLYLWHYPIYRGMFNYGFHWEHVLTIGTSLTLLMALVSALLSVHF